MMKSFKSTIKTLSNSLKNTNSNSSCNILFSPLTNMQRFFNYSFKTFTNNNPNHPSIENTDKLESPTLSLENTSTQSDQQISTKIEDHMEHDHEIKINCNFY